MKPLARTNEDIAKHIDPSKPVRVYRNLHRQCLSIMQSGKVVCHAEHILVARVYFIISKAAQKRVRETKRKNVHAFIEGYWTPKRLVPWASYYGDWVELYYNPYTCDGFINRDSGEIINAAQCCDIEADPNVSPYIMAVL